MKTLLVMILWIAFVVIIGACVVDMENEIIKRLRR